MKIKNVSKVIVLAISWLGSFSVAGEFYQSNNSSVAINGYDVVSYFTEDKAVKGSDEFFVNYKDSKFIFSNAKNRDAFQKSPETYTPQYNGYCAYGASRGYKAKTDGEAYSIVNNKLYLNYSLSVRKTWKEDTDHLINKANLNWPSIK